MKRLPPLKPDTVIELSPPLLNVTFSGWLKIIPALPLRCRRNVGSLPFTETEAVRLRMNDWPDAPRLSPPE